MSSSDGQGGGATSGSKGDRKSGAAGIIGGCGGLISGRATMGAPKEIITVDLSQEEEGTNRNVQGFPRSSLVSTDRGSTSSAPVQQPRLAPVSLQSMMSKIARTIREQYQDKATEDQKEIGRLQNLVQILRATVHKVTLEKKDLVRQLNKAEGRVQSLQDGIGVMEEQVKEINSTYGEMLSKILGKQDAARAHCSQAPLLGTLLEEMTFTEIKMEPFDNYRYEEEQYDYYTADEPVPGSSSGVTFSPEDENETEGNLAVPVVCDMVVEPRPPPPSPSAFLQYKINFPDSHRKSSKLLRKYKKVRRGPTKAIVRATPTTSSKPAGIRKYRKKNKNGVLDISQEDEALVSLVYGKKRDRSLFGLRPSSKGLKKRRSAGSENVKHEGGEGPPPKRKRQRLSRDTEAALGSIHAVDETRVQEGNFCTCGLSYESKASLTQHVKYFGKDWKFKCDDCGVRFFTTHYLRKHLVKAHKKTISSCARGCTKCGRIFQSYMEFTMHRRSKECQ